jgi:hypothetical protein
LGVGGLCRVEGDGELREPAGHDGAEHLPEGDHGPEHPESSVRAVGGAGVGDDRLQTDDGADESQAERGVGGDERDEVGDERVGGGGSAEQSDAPDRGQSRPAPVDKPPDRDRDGDGEHSERERQVPQLLDARLETERPVRGHRSRGMLRELHEHGDAERQHEGASVGGALVARRVSLHLRDSVSESGDRREICP